MSLAEVHGQACNFPKVKSSSREIAVNLLDCRQRRQARLEDFSGSSLHLETHLALADTFSLFLQFIDMKACYSGPVKVSPFFIQRVTLIHHNCYVILVCLLN